MAKLKDNLRGWRDAAEIDWFSQFIKAWIPFNAWLTDTYGDLTDRELLDKLKAGSNTVFNKTVPMLDPENDASVDAQDLRLQISELHRLLQGCIIEGRKGRISFENVDIGSNTHKDATREYFKSKYRARRDHPVKGAVLSEAVSSKGASLFSFAQSEYDRAELEAEYNFTCLNQIQRDQLLACYEAVRPRIIASVLPTSGTSSVKFGNTDFVDDPKQIFRALVDVLYGLRNALFHGSITPTVPHNEIYEPAYRIAMRLVRCTI
jgi:hypothetical protein